MRPASAIVSAWMSVPPRSQDRPNQRGGHRHPRCAAAGWVRATLLISGAVAASQTDARRPQAGGSIAGARLRWTGACVHGPRFAWRLDKDRGRREVCAHAPPSSTSRRRRLMSESCFSFWISLLEPSASMKVIHYCPWTQRCLCSGHLAATVHFFRAPPAPPSPLPSTAFLHCPLPLSLRPARPRPCLPRPPPRRLDHPPRKRRCITIHHAHICSSCQQPPPLLACPPSPRTSPSRYAVKARCVQTDAADSPPMPAASP
jgi:hypothetical protein